MPIASHKVDAQLPVQPNLPKSQPEDYRSIAYDDKNVPMHSLLAYVEGSPWTVTYYSQVVSEHNDLREIDPGQPSIYQQYSKIIDLELRVSGPLSVSYDSDTGITGTTGTATLYPFVVPNINDHFVTSTSDNRFSIFRVTNIDRKTYSRDSVFSIDYVLMGYVHDLQGIYDDLNNKAIRTYYFSKDRLVEGLQPLLKDTEHQQVTGLKASYENLVAYYFKTFFNRKYMTLVLPGQSHAIYDSFLVNYLFRIVNTFDAPEIRLIKQIPTDNDLYLSQPQFWELLLNKNYDGLTYCNQKMGIVNKLLFNKNTFIEGIAYSNIEYVVYPDTPDTTVIVHSDPDVKILSMNETIEIPNSTGTIADLLKGQYVENTRTFQLIDTVLCDDKYVLSSNFYSNTDSQSILEILTKDYLKGNSLDLNKLLELTAKFTNWGRLEQFYYGPILLTLLKEADRATYT